MIPLRDNIHSRTFPIITVILIAINFYCFYLELTFDEAGLESFIAQYGFVPARFLSHFVTAPLAPATYVPIISNLFLHGGWLHILGNMWYLWLFGDHVEDNLGHFTFASFYFFFGVIANLAQLVVDPASTIATVGASGAISGILGAYLVIYPQARISILIPLILIFPIIQVRAWMFLIFWFLLQLQGGAAALFISGANIAWWAHVGGFLAGVILAKIVKH